MDPASPLQLLAAVMVIALSLVGSYMGFRIFRQAQQGGGSAEKWVGWSLMLVCGGGYVPLMISLAIPQPEVRVSLVVMGILAAHLGVVCIFVFTRLVFRPDVAWLPWAVRFLTAAMLVTWFTGALYVNWPLRNEPDEVAIQAGLPWNFMSNLLCGIGMAWSAVEAIRQWSVSRKRAVLGLSDPLVANRMLLWGTFTGASVVTNVTGAICAAAGYDIAQVPIGIAIATVASLASTVALWLAFLPPKAWVRWVRGETAAAA